MPLASGLSQMDGLGWKPDVWGSSHSGLLCAHVGRRPWSLSRWKADAIEARRLFDMGIRKCVHAESGLNTLGGRSRRRHEPLKSYAAESIADWVEVARDRGFLLV